MTDDEHFCLDNLPIPAQEENEEGEVDPMWLAAERIFGNVEDIKREHGMQIEYLYTLFCKLGVTAEQVYAASTEACYEWDL